MLEPAVTAILRALATVTGAISCDVASSSPVRAALLQAWQSAAGDPDLSVPKWLQEAPAGIMHDMPHNGIFPPMDNEPSPCPILEGAGEEFSNYKGIEFEGRAEAEIAKYLDFG